MNNNSHFVRKLAYIAAIGILLIPLSLISRPATFNTEGSATGGKLALLRDDYQLSQSKLMEIDPASETMKLASLGLRGVAVNLLWMQVIEHKKKENYNKLDSTLRALTKIQPNFVKVWEYQGHNLAYNISMEFDDYESRYQWVKKGIGFLKQGIPYNRSDHRMLEHLGFFTGMKIGRSDEKRQFRRMFREDNPFHELMSDYIDPDSYDTRDFGHDNWKMAHHWYRLAVELVDDGDAQQYTSDARFRMHAPAQLRNQGLSLNTEFRPGQVHQDIWQGAAEGWEDYGTKKIKNTFGVDVTMEGVTTYQAELERLQDRLDEFGPEGLREEMMKEIMKKVKISEREQAALDTPPDQRTDEQFVLAVGANSRIAKEDSGINLMIANQSSEENKREARSIFDKINYVKTQIGAVGTHDSVTNYRYWRTRNRAEANEQLLLARQALFDAEQLAKKSIFEDEYVYDYESKTKSITGKGAISMYEEAFRRFSQILDDYPLLRAGELADSLVDSLKEYKSLLDISGMDWPEKDFPLQIMIDSRAEGGEVDGLPTTEMLEEMRSGREEAVDPLKTEADTDEENDDSSSVANEEKSSADESGSAATEEKSTDDAKDDESASKETVSKKSDENEADPKKESADATNETSEKKTDEGGSKTDEGGSKTEGAGQTNGSGSETPKKKEDGSSGN